MRVALIVCPGWTMNSPPLGAPLLKSYLRRRGHECIVVDLAAFLLGKIEHDERERLIHSNYEFLLSRVQVRAFLEKYEAVVRGELDRIIDFRPDVAGFTAYSSSRVFSEEVSRLLKARRPALQVVLGGPECKQMLENKVPVDEVVDAIIPGEGEIALAALVENMAEGRFRPTPGSSVRHEGRMEWLGPADEVEILDELPFPDFSDLPLDNYLQPPTLVTYFSRGCPKKCTFCDVEFNWGGYRNRSGERVFAEVSHLLSLYPRTERFFFCDSITNANMKALVGFCDQVIAAKLSGRMRAISWSGYQAIRPEMTREVLQKMRDSGCTNLWIGVESGSQKVLNLMKKGYKVEVADRVIKDCGELGISVTALLMVGYPGETEADFEQTLDFVRRNAPYLGDVSCSENFTYITNNTYLHKHALDVYGVDPATFHADYWQAKDGSNNYLDRCGRFERLAQTVLKEKVRFGSQMDIIRSHRERYLEHEARRAADALGRR
ncbi:MAG: B12-binding domain-containing radical SAM protein [Elusimicrobiota bacterium]